MPIFLQAFVTRLVAEWNNITGSMTIFILALIVATYSAYRVGVWKNTSVIEALREQLILSKQHAEGLIDTLKQQLAHKDQQIEGLTERVQMIPAPGSHLTKLSHAELKASGLNFVRLIREWLAKGAADEMVRHHQDFTQRQRTKNEEERKRDWDANTEASIRFMERQRQEFDTKFKANAILLRDELMSRTPRRQMSRRDEMMYENPVNSGTMTSIADDLEGLALLIK